MEILSRKLCEVVDERCGFRRTDLTRMRLADLAKSYEKSRTPHVTADHLTSIMSSLQRLFDGTRCLYVAQMDRARAEEHLNRIAEAGRSRRGRSHAARGQARAIQIGEDHADSPSFWTTRT